MRRRPASLTVAVAVLALLLLDVPAPAAAVFPTLPPLASSEFVAGLAAPVAAPGSSEIVSGTIRDPLAGPLLNLNLTLELYAFNAYPGNATGPLPDGSPTFEAPTGASSSDWFDVPGVLSGGTYAFSAPLVVPASAPAGDFAIRLRALFSENGSTYLLESRGYFSYAVWTNATAGPNGTTTLNLTALDVSGVIPETAVLVRSNPFPWVFAGLVGGAVVLAGLGGYYAVRARPGSRSGARAAAPASAPSALGKSASRDGD